MNSILGKKNNNWTNYFIIINENINDPNIISNAFYKHFIEHPINKVFQHVVQLVVPKQCILVAEMNHVMHFSE